MKTAEQITADLIAHDLDLATGTNRYLFAAHAPGPLTPEESGVVYAAAPGSSVDAHPGHVFTGFADLRDAFELDPTYESWVRLSVALVAATPRDRGEVNIDGGVRLRSATTLAVFHPAELIETYGAGRDLHHTGLGSLELSGADLPRINLAESYLGWTRFDLADLSGADLSEADLSHGSFDRAVLTRANLRGADLTRCSLPAAVLRDADLRGAKAHHATFEDADLRGADLRGADLSTCDLRGVALNGARLDGCALPSA